MSVPLMQMLTGRRAGWLAAGVIASVVILVIVGYRAVTEWQHSAAELAQRRADGAAEQLLTAITRDMRGVQTSVLPTLAVDNLTPNLLLDMNAVGSAFARYPYVEVFFASVTTPNAQPPTYYSRADQVPPWLTSLGEDVLFPVWSTHDEAIDRLLRPGVSRSSVEGRQFATFDVQLGGALHQVVAFIRYEDASRERVSSVVGFLANLDWVRQHYFQDIVTQVVRMQGSGVSLRVSDAGGVTVAQSSAATAGPSSIRRFPLLFFNPALIALDPPADLARVYWNAEATTGGDRALIAAHQGARRTMSIAAASAVVLAFGFAFALQAVRTNARLTAMRSEFVSAVTHELKTPIATIRAASETLASGRPLDPRRSQEYAELAVRESKRLTRLIDNLLAYSRITDLTEAYAFELLDAGSLLRQILQDFQSQLTVGEFTVSTAIASGLPPIRADRPAMSLAIGNLIDNAIRYSTERRTVTVSAELDDGWIVLGVKDSGIGIPPHELSRVTHRFFRGEGAIAGGSGLGLAIVQRIVTDHGGKLSIVSEPEHGTTVLLKLPHAGGDRETAHSDS